MLDQQLYLFPERDVTPSEFTAISELRDVIDQKGAVLELTQSITAAIAQNGPAGLLFVGHSPALTGTIIVKNVRDHLTKCIGVEDHRSLSPNAIISAVLPPPGGGYREQRGLMVQRLEENSRSISLSNDWQLESGDDLQQARYVETNLAQFTGNLIHRRDDASVIASTLSKRRIAFVFITNAELLFSSATAKRTGPGLCEFLRDVALHSGTTFILLGHRHPLLLLRSTLGVERLPHARWVHQRLYDPTDQKDLHAWTKILKGLLQKLGDSSIMPICAHAEIFAKAVAGDVSRLSNWLRSALLEVVTKGAATLTIEHLENTAPKFTEIKAAEEEARLYREWDKPSVSFRSLSESNSDAPTSLPTKVAHPKKPKRRTGPRPGTRKPARDICPKGRAA